MKKHYKILYFRLIIIFLVLFSIFYVINKNIKPIIMLSATSAAKQESSLQINSAISNAVYNNNFTYDDFVIISYDNENNIQTVSSNTININKIKTDVTIELQKFASEDNTCEFKMPLGTLTGIDLFLGKGPNITVKVQLANNISTNIVNEFTTAGINQTRLQVNLNVTTRMTVMVSWFKQTEDITTNFTLVDTVIVGEVPSEYTNVIGSSDLEQDVNDYGAGNND